MMNMKRIHCILLFFVLSFGELAFGKTVHIRKVGESPNFVVLSPDGNYAYVTSWGTGELIEVDLNKRAVARSLVVGVAPLGIALGDGGKTAYIACKDTGTVAVVNLVSFNDEVGDRLRGGAIDRDAEGVAGVGGVAPGVLDMVDIVAAEFNVVRRAGDEDPRGEPRDVAGFVVSQLEAADDDVAAVGQQKQAACVERRREGRAVNHGRFARVVGERDIAAGSGA